ncbi:MAG TPA: hypothetical protein PLA50_19685, partial [Bacteroidia bacterium]|nr:hypothetical protein [Bacteroidia bacterium]
ASGHFGGAMVHEPSYLTQYAPEMLKPALEIGLGGSSHTPDGPKEATGGEEKPEIPVGERLVYEDFVAPIFANTCNECHNENKTKGKLRTDTHEQLIAGAKGSDYPTIVPGAPDESELISRVLLPHDDDEFMPPQGDPLQAPEIELLKLWIKAGAKTETTVAELGDDPAVAATVAAVAAIHADGKAKSAAEAAPVVSAVSAWDALSPEEQQARLDEVAEAAEKHHFSVMPISADDGRLKVNVINAAKDFGDEQLKLLGPVADRIAWLDLARSQVTDEGMGTVRSMGGLERLHLENTAVGDSGIAKLAGLPKLEYLNLYGTKVGNGILDTFKSLPALKKVYVWQTAVNADQAKAYERSVNLEINTGVEVPETPPVTEKKAEAPKPEAPKPAEPKPEAPKAEAPKPANPPAQPAANASGGTPEPRQPAAPAPKPAEPKPEVPKAEAPKPATPAPKPEEKKPEAPQPTEKKEA